MERLYFTGYVLSTLGVGNFKPTSSFFEILTSLFSFFGFIFFTTSMTYLVSISSAVINKRSLALAIRNLGASPDEVVSNLLNMDISFCYQQLSNLQHMIGKHTIYYEAYPVLHYYNNPNKESSLGVNFAILDEAISIMVSSRKEQSLKQEIQPLRSSLGHFLNHLKEKFGEKTGDAPFINWHRLHLPEGLLQESFMEAETLTERRKILGDLLESEGYSWR